jgi:periplasmic copper chaperone A
VTAARAAGTSRCDNLPYSGRGVPRGTFRSHSPGRFTVLFRKSFVLAVASCSLLSLAATARAHVSVSGPAFAGKSQVLTFGVGHGCEGADTFRVEVAIPEQVTVVRALPSAWGEAVLTRNDADIVTGVTWTKSDVRDADDQYYQFSIRISVPDAPFTTLYFPATQTCRNSDGEELTAAWATLPEDVDESAEGEEVLEAPALLILPPRLPGWNKYTAQDDIADLSVFDDAQIVWVGDAAYSANPETTKLIKSEDDVEELTEIEAGAEIWVKY